MRQVKSFDDVNSVLKDIQNQLDNLRTKDIDLKHNRCRNASPSLDDYDYVIRKELVELYTRIKDLDNRLKKYES